MSINKQREINNPQIVQKFIKQMNKQLEISNNQHIQKYIKQSNTKKLKGISMGQPIHFSGNEAIMFISDYLTNREFYCSLYQELIKSQVYRDLMFQMGMNEQSSDEVNLQGVSIYWKKGRRNIDYIDLDLHFVVNGFAFYFPITLIQSPSNEKYVKRLERAFESARQKSTRTPELTAYVAKTETRLVDYTNQIMNFLWFQPKDLFDIHATDQHVFHWECFNKSVCKPWACINIGGISIDAALDEDDVKALLEIKRKFMTEEEYALVELEVLSNL